MRHSASLILFQLLYLSRHLCCLFAVALSSALASAQQWSLSSPEKRCEIAVSLSPAGDLTYEVTRAGKLIIPASPLGLVRDDENFGNNLKFNHASEPVLRNERYELFAGIQPKVDTPLNRRSLEFLNSSGTPLILDLAASDEGVAFRYRFPSSSSEIREIHSERTAFTISPSARAWLQPYHYAGPYTPAYEDFYFQVAPTATPPRSRQESRGWAFPALFHLPQAETWLLITESSSSDPYPGCHLELATPDGLFRIAFPEPEEPKLGESGKHPTYPHYSQPWEMPWRLIILAPTAADIATSTLVTDLAPATTITDTSWIRPGRASWAWWSHPDGPFTAETFNRFTDLAAEMGWEYTLFDAHWWQPGIDVLNTHAKAKGIETLVWSHATDFYDPQKRRQKLDQIASDGTRGLKADFWCSDRQEALATMHSLFADAAERKLLVNLHGNSLPRGWHRTWPNFITAEAVLGTESYFYEAGYPEKAAELNTILPFTRNVVGPMDYTPVAISLRKYPRRTTAAHELATAIIFTSGMIHYADNPDTFAALPPEARRVLRDAPARWDETRCLIADPGSSVVFARRSGDAWFIAGINGTNETLPLTLDLSAFHSYQKRSVIEEGDDSEMKVRAISLSGDNSLEHSLPPRGGFILHLRER